MRRISTLTATTLSVALVLTSIELTPRVAFAQEPAAAEDPNLAEAKTLYKEGEIKFQTAEYEEALALWKRAYGILPDGEDTRAIRNALVYNIAEAHGRAYEVSRNPTHLRKAKILLENYRTEHRELYGDDATAVKERAEADDRIAELDKKLAESEAKGETATPLDDGGTTTTPVVGPTPLPPPTKPLSPTQQWEQDVKMDPELGPKWEKGGKQVVGGAVLTGIGGIFLLSGAGLVAWGFQLRATFDSACDPSVDIFCDSLDGTGALVSGAVFGVIGLGMVAPGIALIVLGAKRRKEVKAAKPKPVGFRPYFDPKRGGGASMVFRF